MRNRILTVFALGLVAVLLVAANTTQAAVAQQVTTAASPAATSASTSAPTAQPTPDPFAYKAYDASHFGPCPANWMPLFKPDPVLYPFKDNCFQHNLGTIHYVDEGPKDAPETILFVQGNPNWSFMFHDAMSYMIGKGYRVLAVDQFGFGLSDSLPLDKFDYTPRHQSYILEELVTGLNLTHITLVVHDWGGPIGLGMAGREPDRIARLIINNTTGFALDLNAPGYISRGAQWGTIAAKNQAAIIAQCLVPKQAATEEAYAYDPTQGNLYKRVYAMTIAGFLDVNGKPLHTWSCAPPVLMPASIVNDPTYIPQVEANLTKLVGKPYSLVYTAGDKIFGEMHADMTDPKNQ